jgi:GH15 family glucan-1,4-alpha-glucosidase
VDVSAFALHNFRIGDAAGGREPSNVAEEVAWDDPRQTFYEYSANSQGTLAHVALSPIAHRSVNGVFAALPGLQDLDDVSSAGPADDIVPGFQSASVSLAPAATTWLAVATVWALDEDAAPDVDALLTFYAGMTPQQIVDDELARWAAWHTPAPAALDAEQQRLWRQQAALLRMGQVREPGAGFGQVLASLPPGLGDLNAQWNIAWVRDMAYATAGFARSGHLDEARAALAFQLDAPRGQYTAEVGAPYRISVTRYFGDGKEESDCNADGPNIEFDGFGLFLWSLGEYARAGGDLGFASSRWDVLRDEVADVLVGLIGDDDVIAPDSSIWEVHWNGNQKRFTYTSLAAAAGLCAAADVAETLGHDADAARWRAAGARVRDAVVEQHTDASSVLAQSAEDLATGSGYVDAAAVEAINWGVVDPMGAVAQATLDRVFTDLALPGVPGLMRNDDGGWYDSQEWVFVDLRLVPALAAAGRTQQAATLLAWLEQQALANDHQLSELHTAVDADYAGSIPMVGFGAGAYLIARSPGAVLGAACGSYGDAPAPDAGPDAGAPDAGDDDAGSGGDDAGAADAGDDDAGARAPDAGTPDAGAANDAGVPAPDAGGSLPPRDAGGGDDDPPGCACATTGDGRSLVLWCVVATLAARRRRRA